MMKSTGIVRKVDELGRIVLPIELRRTLGIDEKDALEIYVDQEKIILKKFKTQCGKHLTTKTTTNPNSFSIIFPFQNFKKNQSISY